MSFRSYIRGSVRPDGSQHLGFENASVHHLIFEKQDLGNATPTLGDEELVPRGYIEHVTPEIIRVSATEPEVFGCNSQISVCIPVKKDENGGANNESRGASTSEDGLKISNASIDGTPVSKKPNHFGEGAVQKSNDAPQAEVINADGFVEKNLTSGKSTEKDLIKRKILELAVGPLDNELNIAVDWDHLNFIYSMTNQNDRNQANEPVVGGLYGELQYSYNNKSFLEFTSDFFYLISDRVEKSVFGNVLWFLVSFLVLIYVVLIPKTFCPAEPLIISYLLVSSAFGVVGPCIVCILPFSNPCWKRVKIAAIFWKVMRLALFAWFLAGCYWVYKIYPPDSSTNSDKEHFCDLYIYEIALFYVSLGLLSTASFLLLYIVAIAHFYACYYE